MVRFTPSVALLFWLGLLLVCQQSCSAPQRTLAVVSASGIPEGTQSLLVTASVGRQRAEQTVSESLGHFGLLLPDNANGSLTVNVEALQADGCSTASGSTTVELTEAVQLELSVVITPRATRRCPIVLEKQGPGSLVMQPGGLVCDSVSVLPVVCTGFIDDGGTATLTATADPLANFAGWSGACSGADACQLTVSQPTRAIARFAPNTLTVERLAGSGVIESKPKGILCGTQCRANFVRGTAVTLVATPTNKDDYVEWSGACSGNDECTVKSDSPTSVQVRFLPSGITITRLGGAGEVVSEPPGISCGAQCAANFPIGARVVLKNKTQPGEQFAGWSQPCSGDGDCTITISHRTALTAPFVKQSCARGKVCLEGPLPTAYSLYGVQNFGEEAWMVGEGGTFQELFFEPSVAKL